MLFICAIITFVFYTNTTLLLGGHDNERAALAFPYDDSTYSPLLYRGQDSKQSTFAAVGGGESADIVPLSSTGGSSSRSSSSSDSYGFSGSTGISVRQNVTQQNVCSSNTAYCYNEIDNDFNVNPP